MCQNESLDLKHCGAAAYKSSNHQMFVTELICQDNHNVSVFVCHSALMTADIMTNDIINFNKTPNMCECAALLFHLSLKCISFLYLS